MYEQTIAVVGMGLRYPSAETKEALCSMLEQGISAPVGDHQARGDLLGIPDYHRFLQSIRCIDHLDWFDNSYFGLVKPEVMEMPPELRLTMLCAAQTVMDGGYSTEKLSRRRCGAVVSHTTGSYRHLLPRTTFLSFFNNMPGMTCGYLAHYFRLNGPVYHLDSTCSSSLTAVAAACNHLLLGQADLMLAGDVQICLPINQQEARDMQSNVLSLGAEQRCIPFDIHAAGFYSGEGAGFVLLERYEDAVKCGDHIYGIIRGYGMQSNADLSPTIYAPNAQAQLTALRQAWDMAGITREDLTEFEAHGAATKQGDAAEVQSMTQALTGRENPEPVYLTAVKSNLGHTGCAAGITSLLKMLCAFQQHAVYPIAGFTEPAPELKLSEAHLEPVRRTIQMEPAKRRIADIGSYGLNELNVHLVLENYIPEQDAPVPEESRTCFLKCSGCTEDALRLCLEQIRQAVQETNQFGDLIYTLNCGREDLAYRCFLRFRDRQTLLEQLQDPDAVRVVKCRPMHGAAKAFSDPAQLEQAYLTGDAIDWCSWYQNAGYRSIPTVTYPFAHKSIWPKVPEQS